MVPLLLGQTDDVEEIRRSADSAWETFVEALPRAGIALGVLVLFIVVGRALRPLVRRRLAKTRTPSFARVFARLTSAGATVLGALFAVTIVFPSVRPVNLLAGAGVLSVAVGFAFQDILQNLLAGVLLLFREPFRGGDQIHVGDVSGTVEEINVRETVVKTFDGRRVLIPNATVYTDVIRVQTAEAVIRTGFTVGIAYEADMRDARRLALEAVAAVDGVAADPPPQVLYTELGAATVDLCVEFWCSSRQLEMRLVLSDAIEAVKTMFDRNGIEMPAEVIALQGTASFAAAIRGDAVTPGGAVARTDDGN